MGKPSKQEYRKYNIKTVVGPDDYASMKEVVRRRYGRAIEERSPLPDLIITDGGKGQMEVVRSVVEDELGLSIPIAGLAKDGKHRTSELLFGFPPVTVGMRLDSPLFHLLTRIQDEVHRFAITFHKDKRSKTQTKSELDTIKGIGEKTKVLLLRHFKSVKRIKEASFEELKSVIGEAKAKALQEGLDGKRTESDKNRTKANKMRTVTQRVQHASVTIDGQLKSKIGKGLLVLVGIEDKDTQEDIEWLAKKITNLRIFDDENGVMNRSVIEAGGEIMVVSQFTLHASTKKGNRPSYLKASKPDIAIPMYKAFCEEVGLQLGKPVQTGTFGADMKIELLNDGPVTIIIDSQNKE